jgi:hypothetical protein
MDEYYTQWKTANHNHWRRVQGLMTAFLVRGATQYGRTYQLERQLIG